ncbi:4-hydroxy-3-methylbut-2-enyl diphosphate reductase, partial [Nitrospinota bacterium]
MKLAKSAGFCWGVERALDIVLDTANRTDVPVFTYGPLIHNPQTVSLLEQKNITAADPKNEPVENGLLVIRAHGISPQVRERIRESGSTVRDATCPLVAKVHGTIRKHSRQGAHTIIIGEEGHPEVEGHMGYAEAGYTLVTCLEDLAKVPGDLGEVIVVAQTTINMGDWKDVVEELKNRYPQARMFNTICDATEVRQEEVRRMAPEVELMVIVGGRNSGNTARLASVAQEEGAISLLIETEDEIDPEYLRKFKSIGVTAGASTPDWMIRRVVNRIESISDPVAGMSDRLVQGLKVLSRSNLLLMLTASMASIASAALGGFPISAQLTAVAALYLFSMHTMNRCTSLEADQYNEPNRAQFYEKYRGFLL